MNLYVDGIFMRKVVRDQDRLIAYRECRLCGWLRRIQPDRRQTSPLSPSPPSLQDIEHALAHVLQLLNAPDRSYVDLSVQDIDEKEQS